MRFLLSIHDVWPGNRELVQGYLRRLKLLGAGPVALLVVPFYHGRQTMESDPEFIAWLRAEAMAGTETLLHGFYHRMPELVEGDGLTGKAVCGPSLRRSRLGKWINKNFVNQEAEFCGLDIASREKLLNAGIESFRKMDMTAPGFVAPTWHGSPPVQKLRDAGLSFWETRFRIHDLESQRSRWALPVAWDQSRGGPVLAGGDLWLTACLRFPLIKVALHPGDLSGAETEKTMERIFSAGSNIQYRDLFPKSAC